MGKKGVRAQVSAFIIIAVLIVAVAGGYFLFKQTSLDLRLGVNPKVKPVYSFVESCIKETAEDAVEHIGKTGGYFASTDLSLKNGIAYYFDGENHMPSKEQIEEELSIYIDEMLFFCISGFNDFPDLNIEQDNVTTSAVIENERVVFNVRYPLRISKGEKTYSFEDFNIEIPVRLGVIYDVINALIKEQMSHKKSICLGCIAGLGAENNLNILITDIDEGVVFSVVDENSKINNQDFVFYFANKYDYIDIW